MNKEHKHNWKVVLEVKTGEWEEFMRFRDDVTEFQGIHYAVTHTVFCPECKEFKIIN